MKNNSQTKKFFAAANSYNGFVSFFDQVFESKDYDKVYVLKGGPGTGKSSFMRSVIERFISENIEIEEILCSSDPNSLDGIILTNFNKKIAIIDGTSPHERDAVIPGVIDQIINLGDNIDNKWISAQREEILKLNDEKKKAYKTAYSYLSIAGTVDNFITDIYSSIFNKKEAKIKAEEIFSGISTSEKLMINNRLISSFGRRGDYKLDTLEGISKNTVTIYGDEIVAKMILDVFCQVLSEKNTSFTRLICPKNTGTTDAIYIHDCALSVVRGLTGAINADSFISDKKYDKEQIRTAKTIKHDALEEAKRWFNIASDFHFRLEDIYTRAMDFDKNNDLIQKKLIEIENILKI